MTQWTIFLMLLLSSVSNATPVTVDKPVVLLEEIKPFEDKRKIIVPVRVEAKIQSIVSAETEGHITKILKPLGTKVKTGEVVLYIENKDPGFTYAAVPVRSPISGVLSQVWTSPMAKVSRGDKLFTVLDPNTLKLTAEFAAGDLNSLKTGMQGEFKLDSQKELSLGIRVMGISPLVDAHTGTVSAEFEFLKTSSQKPPIGTIGQAQFEIKQGSIILIPEASVVYQDGKSMVRILKAENRFDKKLIELGEQRDSFYVVKSGLIQGDKVIVRSNRPLKEGEVLEVEKPKEKVQ